MWDIVELLERRQLDVGDLRERMYRAPTPREAGTVACSLAFGPGLGFFGGSRGAGTGSPHHRHVGHCLRQRWSHGPWLRTVGWLPPALDGDQQAQLKAAVQALPEKAGIGLANWNWKVVRRFVQERFGLSPSRSSCLNYLHRLGFVLKRAEETFPEGRRGQAGSLRGGVCRTPGRGATGGGEGLLR